MHSLATIQRMNSAIESMKARKRAEALNSGGKGHAKDAEKGRAPAPEKMAFEKHLEFATKTVESWPAWKKKAIW